MDNQFQSTLPARGATSALRKALMANYISIHAPRTGSDGGASAISSILQTFQSTLPARGATHADLIVCDDVVFQSTLPARGATADRILSNMRQIISIHAPRTGSDLFFSCSTPISRRFQSTLPARGATFRRNQYLQAHPYFNPRSPHGERRLQRDYHGALDIVFQSTLPARGATKCGCGIHAFSSSFQSTLPARGATDLQSSRLLADKISIHAPRTGSDSAGIRVCRHKNSISIHAPRTGSDAIQSTPNAS